jgi:hypothetical protein
MPVASDIIDIYDAIEALSVTVDGVTPLIYDLDELPNTADTAHLPARWLFPLASFGGFGRDTQAAMRWVTLNSITQVTWQIRDLCLWRPTGQGIGWKTIAPTLVKYAGLYVDKMTANRQLTIQSYIAQDGLFVQPGVIEFPDQSGRRFYGINAQLTVIEHVSST